MTYISVTGLDEAEILAELYNRALHCNYNKVPYDPNPLSIEKARKMLNANINKTFEYINGRLIKVSFTLYPKILTYGYDDFNPIKARECIQNVREGVTVLKLLTSSPHKSIILAPRTFSSTNLKISPKSKVSPKPSLKISPVHKSFMRMMSSPKMIKISPTNNLKSPYDTIEAVEVDDIDESPKKPSLKKSSPKQLSYKISLRNMGIGLSYEN